MEKDDKSGDDHDEEGMEKNYYSTPMIWAVLDSLSYKLSGCDRDREGAMRT